MKRLKQALWHKNGESRIIDGLRLALKAFEFWLIIWRQPYDENLHYWFFSGLEMGKYSRSSQFVKDEDGFYFWIPF